AAARARGVRAAPAPSDRGTGLASRRRGRPARRRRLARTARRPAALPGDDPARHRGPAHDGALARGRRADRRNPRDPRSDPRRSRHPPALRVAGSLDAHRSGERAHHRGADPPYLRPLRGQARDRAALADREPPGRRRDRPGEDRRRARRALAPPRHALGSRARPGRRFAPGPAELRRAAALGRRRRRRRRRHPAPPLGRPHARRRDVAPPDTRTPRPAPRAVHGEPAEDAAEAESAEAEAAEPEDASPPDDLEGTAQIEQAEAPADEHAAEQAEAPAPAPEKKKPKTTRKRSTKKPSE